MLYYTRLEQPKRSFSMRTFKGWYLEAKRYTDLGSVPRTQDPDTVDGAVALQYDLISRKNHEYKNGVIVEKKSVVIETNTNVNLKKDDRVFVGEWLKVIEVDTIIPKEKEKVVRLYPNYANKVAVKRVVLN